MPSNCDHAIACERQLAVAEEGPRAPREEIGGSSRMSWLFYRLAWTVSTSLNATVTAESGCFAAGQLFSKKQRAVAKKLASTLHPERGRAIQDGERTVEALQRPKARRWAVVRSLDEVQGSPGRTEPCTTICAGKDSCGAAKRRGSRARTIMYRRARNKSTRPLLYNAQGGRGVFYRGIAKSWRGSKTAKATRCNAD